MGRGARFGRHGPWLSVLLVGISSLGGSFPSGADPDGPTGVSRSPGAVSSVSPASPPAPAFGGPILIDESFEGGGFPPPGWVRFGNPDVPDSATWHATNRPVHVRTGDRAALVQWQSVHDQDENLGLPRLDLRSLPGEDLRLSVWHHAEPFWAPDSDLQIRASTDSASWTSLWRLSDLADSGWAWRNALLDLSPYAGELLFLRVRYVGRNGADFSIDDVRVGYIEPPTAPANDDCAGASADTASFGIGPDPGPFTVSGNNTLATPDYSLPDAGTSCTGSTHAGRDLVWVVHVPREHRITATMTTAGGWDDTLFLIADCGDPAGSCLAGDRQIPDGSTITWANWRPTVRVLWLIASAWDGGFGEFTVTGSVDAITAIEPTTWGEVKALYR